jgi:hypothetical protein
MNAFTLLDHPRAALCSCWLFVHAGAADLRIGMIGLDTSHVVAFTELLNNPASKNHVAGGKVVAGFKGGSPDIESSWSRVENYTKELQQKHGVKIYDTIEELCQQVDAVMLESVDGRPHLDQARPVIKAAMLYIDKPIRFAARRLNFGLAKPACRSSLVLLALRKGHPSSAAAPSAKSGKRRPTALAIWIRPIRTCSGTACTEWRLSSR